MKGRFLLDGPEIHVIPYVHIYKGVNRVYSIIPDKMPSNCKKIPDFGVSLCSMTDASRLTVCFIFVCNCFDTVMKVQGLWKRLRLAEVRYFLSSVFLHIPVSAQGHRLTSIKGRHVA